ncbi:MAG: NADH-ubiquinone/plastoquinone oxidoreductase chain 6 [Desulfovibrionaceae bacterium]|jgi:NADH-quinone oxidoreductase subunit J|nr:NADH-ubiquinone/plastoquinone oxidoreductase chain 6 [Desulfovibrionaceae bacterium]
MLSKFIFLYCALMIVTTGILAVRFRNPVHSVLAVLVLFFHMAGLYLLLNAEFLAAIQIIVYAGAILVLYLFVLFLVNIRQEIKTERFVENHNISKFISFLVFLMLIAVTQSFRLGVPGEWTTDAINQATHTKALGIEIFTSYILPFEIIALILLVAVVGGILLAKQDKQEVVMAPDEGSGPLTKGGQK